VFPADQAYPTGALLTTTYYLFYDRVERTARAADVDSGCLLNHAFAHEIVHVLLP